MYRIAFKLGFNDIWMGGIYYYKNLLYAISTLNEKEKKIEPWVFSDKKNDDLIKTLNNDKITYFYAFDKKRFKWFITRSLNSIFGENYIFFNLSKKYNISLISHSSIDINTNNFKIINWIPDFQHIHLKEMFSEKEVQYRNEHFNKLIQASDIIVVSSYDALKDLKNFSEESFKKARVLQFVAQPEKNIYKMDNISYLNNKYNISKKFFYIPNQFWKHKNHITVFKAVKILKEQGLNIFIVCSGNKLDYRNKDNFLTIQNYIAENSLEENIKILGLIDKYDVMYLFRNSISVINPSLFEGWSTTIEEAKSIGKNVIVSDIPVHREQNAPESIYFNPNDPKSLSKILKNKWNYSNGGPDYKLEEKAKKCLKKRTYDFGKNYQEIILEALLNKV